VNPVLECECDYFMFTGMSSSTVYSNICCWFPKNIWFLAYYEYLSPDIMFIDSSMIVNCSAFCCLLKFYISVIMLDKRDPTAISTVGM
jgi:hypothetical protein